MPLANNSENDKKVEDPTVEFLLKQVYIAHRKKVKALEAEVQQLKARSPNKCLKCETLQRNLEKLKKEYEDFTQMQERKIDILEYHLSIGLERERNERTLLNSSTVLEKDAVALSTSQMLKDDILLGDNANHLHQFEAPDTKLPIQPFLPKKSTSGTLLSNFEVHEKSSEDKKAESEKEINLSAHHLKKSQDSRVCVYETLKDDLPCNEDVTILVPETEDFMNDMDFDENKDPQKDVLDSPKDKWKRIQIKKVENWLNGCDVPETNLEDEYNEDEIQPSRCITKEDCGDRKENSVVENCSCKKSDIVGKGKNSTSKQIDPDIEIIDSNMRIANKENLNKCMQNKTLNKVAVGKCKVVSDSWHQSPSLIDEVSVIVLKPNANKSVGSSKVETKLDNEHAPYISKSNSSVSTLVKAKESNYSKGKVVDKEVPSIMSMPCLKTKPSSETPNFCGKRLRHTKLSKLSQSKKMKHPCGLSSQRMITDDNVLSDEVFESPDNIYKQNKTKLSQKQFSANNSNCVSEQMEDDFSADETFLPTNFSMKSKHMDIATPHLDGLPEKSFEIDPDIELINNDIRIDNKENFNDFSEQSSEDLLQELKMNSPNANKICDDQSGACATYLEGKSLIDSFDLVPEPPKPAYKYKEEPVRKKDARKNLPGHDCNLCEKYYRELGLPETELKERLKLCSRHKAINVPPLTPEHYWDLDFPDTPECKARGYLNVTQKVKLKSRRRQPLQ